MRMYFNGVYTSSLDDSSAIEAESITEAAFLSEDLKEGRQAFWEKGRPKPKGK